MKKIYLTIAAAALIALASGCNENKDKSADIHGEQFVPNDTLRSSQKFMMVQIANGARHDATLHAQHFNGKDLSSLGEQKLDEMVESDQVNEPFTVWINLPKDDPTTTERTDAVTHYLKDKGLSDDQIKIEYGENPNSYAPSAPAINALANPPAPAPPASEAPSNMGGGGGMK
jgi:hypothetical protein